MERCPCCNARLRERVICSRCKADLSALISSEKAAQFWLSKAIQYWEKNKTEQSLSALEDSLHLKKSQLAIILRKFLIQRQCQDILDLLAKKQLLSAKTQLYNVRLLLPHSKQLQQVNTFTDYLLARKHQGYSQSIHDSK